MKMEWKSEYSVGVPEIDDQHQELFVLYNDLVVALQHNYAADMIHHYLARFGAYIIYHFKSEDELMQRIKYPLQSEHNEKHEFLKQKFADLVEKSRTGTGDVYRDTYEVLRDWLTDHVTGDADHSDQKLVQFLQPRDRRIVASAFESTKSMKPDKGENPMRAKGADFIVSKHK